jgi:hypothetical protein
MKKYAVAHNRVLLSVLKSSLPICFTSIYRVESQLIRLTVGGTLAQSSLSRSNICETVKPEVCRWGLILEGFQVEALFAMTMRKLTSLSPRTVIQHGRILGAQVVWSNANAEGLSTVLTRRLRRIHRTL